MGLVSVAGGDMPMVQARWSSAVLAALSIMVWLEAANAADPAGSGAEPAIAYTDPTLPTHTVYRPARLTARYPVVLWGNGSCVNSNFGYREFLAEVASHGFIVLAIGPYRDTPAPREQRPADPAEWPPFETRYSQMLDALDWIVAENGRRGGALSGKVEVDKVAVMGHSCGGLQAVRASVDPRVTTAVVLNSGMMADGDQYMRRHELERSILEEMHAPIAYFIGGESDIAFANAEEDWRALQRLQIAAVNANMDVGHGATYQMPNGGPFARGPLAWLQWQLKGDGAARAMFVGDACGLCADGDWTVRRHFPR
jgi:dienelactone hydrolase